VLENCSFQYCLLTELVTSILITLTSTLNWRTFHFINVSVVKMVFWLKFFVKKKVTVEILNTICNCGCFTDCSLDLTLKVLFWKIAFLVCRWKQIIISRSWNWAHLQFRTQCLNGCQCVLCNFQWFLFSIVIVIVLYLWASFFLDTVYS